MGRRARRGHWVVVVALLVNSCTSTKPGVVAHDATPITSPAIVADTAVAVDPDVRIVTLANGLTVYLRKNNRPGASAEMRLVINAGSGQEDADQSGTAHFLEHMMFNGTAQFPGNQLVDTLRSFGMEFGADLNASTNYDETVFELTVPTTKSTNLGTGLDVLREWLSAATLDPAQVDSEKGVVLDEWRQSEQSFHGRAAKTSEAMFLAGSGYEGRQTIGSDTAINAMTPELLRRFYDNWYRPDNAAIMVVGDIDVDSIEAVPPCPFELCSDGIHRRREFRWLAADDHTRRVEPANRRNVRERRARIRRQPSRDVVGETRCDHVESQRDQRVVAQAGGGIVGRERPGQGDLNIACRRIGIEQDVRSRGVEGWQCRLGSSC